MIVTNIDIDSVQNIFPINLIMSQHSPKVSDQPNTKTQLSESAKPNLQTKQEQNFPQSQDKANKNVDQRSDQIPEVKAEQLTIDEDEQDNQIQKFQQNNPDKANQYKNKGNQLFKQGKFNDAILEYQQGLKYTSDKNVRATLYSNMAISFMKQEDYVYAKRYCKKVLKQDENHRKGRMNLGRCLQQDKKIQQAFEQYKKVEQNLEGASSQDIKFIKDKIAYLKPKIDELNQTRKKQVMDGLKNIGNTFLGYFGMSLDNFKLEQGQGGGYNISFKQ